MTDHQKIERLRDALVDLEFGARLLVAVFGQTDALAQYAMEVCKVATAALTDVGKGP